MSRENPNNSKANLSVRYYGNGVIMAPDGVILARHNEKKLQWYLDRNLADKICDDPPTIRLKFEPAGRKHAGDMAFIEDKHNRCVVCGATEKLSRHHILPYCYRRHLPEKVKRHSCYDITLLCRGHHDEYEAIAFDFKREIGHKYKAPIEVTQDIDILLLRAKKNALAVKKHGNLMPANRRDVLMWHIAEYFKIDPKDLTDKHLEQVVKSEPCKPIDQLHGELVAKQLKTDDEIHEFIIMWRKHFLEIMKPRFLSPHWTAERKLL